jgi:Tfp pilus assembly ATPase PilU
MEFKNSVLERDIEDALIRKVKKLGGMCEKFTSPSKRSVPDRIVTLPGGIIIFVEVKAPGKKPTINQELDHKQRIAYGCDVRVIDSVEQIRRFPDK